jgi:alpha-mannosidase
MSLNNEWGNRVKVWMNELKEHFFRELGIIELEGFTTKELLPMEEALKGSFKPVPQGTRWGGKWEYGWFKGQVTLPDMAKGKRIVIRLNPGGEGIVYINGVISGAKDKQHHEITLCMEGIPGQAYDILTECYAGHGPQIENISPTPPGRVAVPEPGPTQAVIGKSTFGIWEEEAYQLWMDVDTLLQVRLNIDENSLRTAEIDRALKDFTLIADYEEHYEKRVKTFKACRERLKPLLECVNGSTSPTMFIFGQSHIDLAWKWPFAETIRKCARTLSTQMSYMDEYPGYRFFLSQPPIYILLMKHYHSLYEKVKKKVKSGQIMPEGGMWVEADTNLPGGESLIRQFIYGKSFFYEEFGVESELLWLPDVFGFSASLPQIMKGCEINYFATQKILRSYTGGEPFPYNVFMWEGIDGSQVLAHIFFKHNSLIDPGTVINRWNDRKQKDGISTFLFPFGYGDGGGGANRDHLEYVERIKDLEGVPKTKMCHPTDFFKDIEKNGIPENTYVGELYFQAHRGTYTSQAKMKKGNRKCEFALRNAELWASVAKQAGNYSYPYDKMDDLWKKVLFNQFHDIVTGASIKRVHEEAEADYNYVLQQAGHIENAAVSSMLQGESGVAVFNSLSWDRTELVALPEGFQAALSYTGDVLPVQLIEGKAFAEVKIPSCGWTTIKTVRSGDRTPVLYGEACAANMEEEKGELDNSKSLLMATERLLENEFLQIKFNDIGEITSIYDKEVSHELTAGLCNSFKMYKDVTNCYDAWDIDSMYEKLPVELDGKAAISVLYSGPLAAAVKIERMLAGSFMSQEVLLRRGSRRVEFKTTIDWKESHKLLKVAFPVDIHTNEGVHEIQFGHVRRPNHRSRQYDADRFEVSNHKWTAVMEENRGFAVMNDCKYGVNVLGGNINLTLLKSPLVPDMYADKGLHEFTYAIYAWNGPFVESGVVREAYELNCPVYRKEGAAGDRSLFSIDVQDVIIETVKPAGDGSDDIIIRLYEACGTRTRCTLFTSLPAMKAVKTNLLEVDEKSLIINDSKIELELKPFEIMTIRLCF